ncbi:MAG: DsbA family oxidoreductase [Polyangiaceae bacterium]|nr:DsbA family oxidoreductase [Myxococcales bacterium]MCB9587867.1 DsbA family oxidoreductase [Polyangiaceae bacterium]MCB9608816.1 DsbA family oxidoreductase [Polyangiaceae bacterium]
MLRIDAFSDVVCPWCFIGKRKLELALAQRPELEVDLRFHPFLLHPYLKPEGEDFAAFVMQKFGSDPGKLFTRVLGVARDAGLEFRPELIQRMPDTTAAHCLISWAPAEQRAALVMALFSAYFCEGKDVGDIQVLAELGADFGLDPALSVERLAAGVDREAIREQAAETADRGITAVPFFLINGRWPVPGAQEPETLLRVLDKAQATGAEVR